MAQTRISSRLQKIEDRKNKQQALLFVMLSVGFILLIIFIGMPLFIKAAVLMGEMKSSGESPQNLDTTAPIPPRLVNDFEATNSAQLSIHGYAEPGSAVTLIKNNERSDEVVTDAGGSFAFTNVKLMDGENTLRVTAKDTAGNESQPSEDTVIIFDNEKPKLNVTSPKDSAEFFDDDREIVVGGETDPDTTLRVNNFLVVVDTEGNFAKKILLVPGEQEITITAKDKAGNESKKTLKVRYSN